MTKTPAAPKLPGFYFQSAPRQKRRKDAPVSAVHLRGPLIMRKVFLVVGAVALAAMTTSADAAKKSKRPVQAASPDASVGLAGYLGYLTR